MHARGRCMHACGGDACLAHVWLRACPCEGAVFKKVIDKGPFDEAYASALFAQIVLAVEHMHKRGLVHRDIKAENIVFATRDSGGDGGGGPPMLKLIDLGGATDATQKAVGLVGTPQYVAPEIITGFGEGGDGEAYDGKACDMWSLGVLLYVMLSKALPFSAREQDKLLKLVVRGTFVFRPKDRWDKISPFAKSLVNGLLKREPHQRMNISQIKSNPWMHDAIKAAEAQAAKLLAEQEASASAPSATSPPPSADVAPSPPNSGGRRGSVARSIIPNWLNGVLGSGGAASGGSKKKYPTSLSFAPQAQRTASASKGLREQNYWYSVHVGGVTVDEDGVPKPEGHVPPEILAELRRMQEEGLLSKDKGGAAATGAGTGAATGTAASPTNPMLKPMAKRQVDVSDGASGGSSDAGGSSSEIALLREQLTAATSRAERAETESRTAKEELTSVRRSHAIAEQEIAVLRAQLQGLEIENRKLRADQA